jgi:hypothetical protein
MSIPEIKSAAEYTNEINKLAPSNESASAKGARPLPNAPSYINCLNQTPKHSKFVAVLLKFAVEYVACAAQFVFYAVKDVLFKNRITLFTYERLNANHLNIYFKKFNQEDNGAIFTNPIYGILEDVGDDWSASGSRGKCHFDFIIEKMIEENFPEIDKTKNFDLSSEMLKRNKQILAIPLNINQRHWTVLHFNFKTKEVSFVDSKGEGSWDKKTEQKIRDRANQAASWIGKKYQILGTTPLDILTTGKTFETNLTSWMIIRPEDNTSRIHKRLQYDKWNCGHQIIQMTYLVAKENKSYQEIESLPFEEIERQINARRKDVITTVNEELNQFNFV